jgi:hypothetical protein
MEVASRMVPVAARRTVARVAQAAGLPQAARPEVAVVVTGAEADRTGVADILTVSTVTVNWS